MRCRLFAWLLPLLPVGCGSYDDWSAACPAPREGYADADGDGYGTDWVRHCEGTPTLVDVGGDCNDATAAIHPGATEVCDLSDIDEDCNGVADDADAGVDPASRASWFLDADGDGYGDPADQIDRCDAPEGRVDNADDCDDTDPARSPAATDVCNGLDDDCDDLIDDADDNVDGSSGTRWYPDEDCNSLVDDEDPFVDTSTYEDWYFDGDGDGYGHEGTTVARCNPPDGYVGPGDCDDQEAAVNPGEAEDCTNGVDDDCNGLLDCEDGTCAQPCTETICDDQLDEDLDGLTDCEDDDCMGLPVCSFQVATRLTSANRVWASQQHIQHGSFTCGPAGYWLSSERGAIYGLQGQSRVVRGTGSTAQTYICSWSAATVSWSQSASFWSYGSCGGPTCLGGVTTSRARTS